jgi:hypothetical protein
MSADPSGIDDMTSNPVEAPKAESTPAASPTSTPRDSYTKLAMRNMVHKPKRSLLEFGLTSVGLLALLIGLSYLTR